MNQAKHQTQAPAEMEHSGAMEQHHKEVVQGQVRLLVTWMQRIALPLIRMQGRNKKGSNVVTHRANWSGIKLKLGEGAVGSTIQMNINKYPIIVQEYLASPSWAVPEVPDKYTVHKRNLGVGSGIRNLAADRDGE